MGFVAVKILSPNIQLEIVKIAQNQMPPTHPRQNQILALPGCSPFQILLLLELPRSLPPPPPTRGRGLALLQHHRLRAQPRMETQHERVECRGVFPGYGVSLFFGVYLACYRSVLIVCYVEASVHCIQMAMVSTVCPYLLYPLHTSSHSSMTDLAGPDLIKFGIESKHSCPDTSTSLFTSTITQALTDMKHLHTALSHSNSIEKPSDVLARL